MVLIIVGVCLSLALVLGFRLGTTTADTDSTREYRLTDKILLVYNGDFCQNIVARSTDYVSTPHSNASLYLLSSPPPLSDVESFDFSDTAVLKKQPVTWNFYLNSGSHVSFNVCLSSSHGFPMVTFYLINGLANYAAWSNDRYDNDAYLTSDLIFSCSSIQYYFVDDDKYFFMFYSEVTFKVHLNVDFSFRRTVYHISPHAVIENCFTPLDGQSSCSLGVPFSSNYTAILSLNTALPVDYSDEAYIQVTCESRVWFYAVIVVCAVVPFIICIISVIVCVCIRAKRNKSKYSQMIEENTTTARQITRNVDVAPAAGRPPAYTDHLYPILHEGYGAVSPSSINSYRQ